MTRANAANRADAGKSAATAFKARERGIPSRTGGGPNAETLEAIREVRKMKADPALGATYTDADAMMKELLSDG